MTKMTKRKSKSSARRGRKDTIQDLTPQVDPKGGATDLTLKGIEGETEARIVLPARLQKA